MILYLPVKQHLFRPDIGCYATYGIAAVPVLYNGRNFCFVSDISVSFTKVAALALRCTVGRLDPAQLEDVVEDFLCN